VNKQMLCPYCFEYFRLEQIHWRCGNTTCRAPGAPPSDPPGEIDMKYAEFQTRFQTGGTTSNRLLHAFAVTETPSFFGKMAGKLRQRQEASCDWCKRTTKTRLCPHCHNRLPYGAGTTDNHIIAIIGAKEVGKSHYITVLIEQFREQVGADFGITLLSLNDNTTSRYKNDFYNPLYKQKQKLEATQTFSNDALMFRLKFHNEHDPFHQSRCLTLVFFDTAGENLDAEETMTARNRYLMHASAIILLVDPLQIDKIRDDLGSRNCPLPQSHTEPFEIVERLIALFHNYTRLKTQAKIDVPLAVAFTKSDVLRDFGVLRPDNAVYTQSRHQGKFQSSIFRQIHDEIQAILTTWSGLKLDSTLQQDFKTYAYFCLSSLGEAPAPDGSLATISPFRVEDPFLWCLTKLGYVKPQ
jgi:hypothetical protein